MHAVGNVWGGANHEEAHEGAALIGVDVCGPAERRAVEEAVHPRQRGAQRAGVAQAGSPAEGALVQGLELLQLRRDLALQ